MNAHPKKFFGGLESLRGIAALIVVFFHITWPNPLTLHLFFRNGYLMVDLFFVLSGFVICHNYGRKIYSINDVARFMFLRFGRLYPLHLFFLLIFLGVEIAKYIGETRYGMVPYMTHAFSLNSLPSFVANLFLIHPFFTSTNISFNHPSWSIGVEFYTYLVFAFVALIFPGKRKLVFVSCVLASLTIVLLSFWAGAGLNERAGLSFLRCVLGFFAGVLAYQAYDKYQTHIARWSGAMTWCSMIVLIVFLSLHSSRESDFAVLPMFVVLIVAVAAAPLEGGGLISNFLNSSPLRWMGAVSYSIYMSHMVINMVMHRLCASAQKHLAPDAGNWLGLVFVFFAAGLVLLASKFTYQWIERPCQKKFHSLAEKWFKPWKGRAQI
jgi:peptidoglycan/LPS O-acetylase OafA/YrhL